jgi:hypothetical protein
MSLVTDIEELLDESGGATFWTAAHVYDAANEAQVETFARTKHQFVLSSMTVNAGDGLVTLPSTVMIPQYIIGTQGKYFPTSQAKLEQYAREWRGATAAYPKHFVFWDAYTVRAFPPSDDDYSFDVGGIPWPSEEVSVSQTDITAPSLLKQAVAHRAAGILLEFTQPTLADSLSSAAEELERKFRIQNRNRQSDHIRRIRPGTIFSFAQSGNVLLGKKFK